MRPIRFSLALRAALSLCVFALSISGSSMATEKKLHNLGGGTDGSGPLGTLVSDAAGNLYGTTNFGGNYTAYPCTLGCGTVFELSPDGNGGYTTKKLHNFGSGTDGGHPQAGLIFDASGNLYGTTLIGGDHSFGTVFEMTPNGDGTWTEKKLHNFGSDSTDGHSPGSRLVFDTAGNLYGTTLGGGSYGGGTVFEMSPNGSGGWTEKKLHNFGSTIAGGNTPTAGVVFDNNGNLYGTTYWGGNSSCASGLGCGTVFELSPNGSGGWTTFKLHNFGIAQTDGVAPSASLLLDAAGNLYGTTSGGGSYGAGTVFEMSPNGSGGWTEKKLHNFGSSYTDGIIPESELIFDTAGNLYGVTNQGGSYNQCDGGLGCGTAFRLTPNANGGWTETKLHNFGISDTDGVEPQSGLLMDSAGNLYGTTYTGGDYDGGTVFVITP